MYPDFKELLSVFNTHRVKYLIVGGYAVSLHAQPRATKDIDILVRPDADNAESVYAALAMFGARLADLAPADFADRGSFLAWVGNLSRWTFCPRFQASILMLHGNVGSRVRST
jgi:hypothetical protein